MLTASQFKFVVEYCKDYNALRAYMRAFNATNEGTAGTEGAKLLDNPEVVAAMQEHQRNLAAAASLTPEWVLQRWREMAEGNPADLMQMRRHCCRHCHGIAHLYQWTPAEYALEVEAAFRDGRTPKDGLGGTDYNRKLPPHPECPECHGEGVSSAYFEDTRTVKGPSRRLFKGVKQTQHGLEVLTIDQADALKNIATYLGMSKQQIAIHTNDNEGKGLEHFYGGALPKP